MYRTVYRVSAFTQKNTKASDKPNEDLSFYDENSGFVLVLDGVSRDKETGIYPNPSPAAEVVSIIKEKSFEYFLAYKDTDENVLLHSVQYANEEVRKYNFLRQLDFAAGAVGIFGYLLGESFHYVYIGDCYGRAIFDGAVDIFTECQTEKISKHVKEFSASFIRNDICNNPSHPYGYGVINGSENANYFMRSGIIDKFDRIILSTDGPEMYVSLCSIDELMWTTPEELIYKSSHLNQDDMTILIISK